MIIAGVDIGECIAAELVGSRVTCSPPPTDTDQDILVLVQENLVTDKRVMLFEDGWVLGGSDVNIGFIGDFTSFRRDDLNLILTSDGDYYRKFMAATTVAKRLNLMDKNDRIALFEAVLYSMECAPRLHEALVFETFLA